MTVQASNTHKKKMVLYNLYGEMEEVNMKNIIKL